MLDSTGHVYMTTPEQQEMDNDFFARHDAERERFAGEADNLEDSWQPDPEDVPRLNR